MGYTDKDFNNPVDMFDMRTRQIRVRIQHLQGILGILKHPYSRAIVKQELNKSVDEYVSRRLQRGEEVSNQ